MDIYQMLRVPSGTPKEKLQEKYIKMLETYQLVADFADDPTVAQLAKSKLAQLQSAGKTAGLSNERQSVRSVETVQTQLESIKMALNSHTADATTLQTHQIPQKIDNLPESGEKHYLKALVLLHQDSSLSGFRGVAEQLRLALEQDPHNAAYRGFYQAICQQVEAQQKILDLAEADRLEAVRKAEIAEANAKTVNFLLGALGVVALGVVGACKGICMCIECMDDCFES